jgi:hypothetical protein
MLLVSTLFSLVCAFSLTVSAAKNCTHDPVTYLSQPIAYLAEHPILTHDIDVLCRDIRKFARLLSVNATNIVATHPNLDLNATEIEIFIANVTAELKVLESNTTLVRLCERAKEVEDGCWPLVYQTWKLNRPECRPAPLQNETEAAGKNETLVKLCEVFVTGCNNNVTVTDAGMFLCSFVESNGSIMLFSTLKDP